MDVLTAVKNGNLGELTRLLVGGTAVDAVDEGGWTALSWAAAAGDQPMVSHLCEHGADVFHLGRDQRSPYLIALAAGHLPVAALLAEAERTHADGRELTSSQFHKSQPYCKAYRLTDFQAFAGWQATASNEAEHQFLFLHRDLSVTRSMWANEEVVFDADTPQWQAYCTDVLHFAPPTDLEEMPSLSSLDSPEPKSV